MNFRKSAITKLSTTVNHILTNRELKMAPGGIPRVGFARLLKDGARHYRGVEESLFRNIEACLGIAATVRSSFGPKGMNKMVVNHLGKLSITNDAAVILRELEVEHPAAKLLVMASEMMDSQIGDGTNSVMILSASLLDSARELIRMGLNVSQIISGYNMASKKALEVLPKFVCKSVNDVRDIEAVKTVIRSAIATKVYGQEDMLSDLVVQACIIALGANYSTYHVDNGSNVEASTVMNGMAFQNCVSGEIKLIEKPKVAVFSCAFGITKLENPSSIIINTANELMQFSKHDEEHVENYIKSLHDIGINVVVSAGKFGDLHLHFLNKYKMMAVKVSSKFDIRRLCRCVQATISPDMSRVPTADMIGSCAKVQVREIGSDQLVFFEQNLKGGNLSTIIIRGSSQNVLDEVEKAVDDGVNTFKQLLKDNRLLPGAGAVELAVAREIRQFGLTCPTLERYAIEKFAVALESLPKQIADNIGAKWVEIYPHLMKKLENGENNYGIDIKAPKGGIVNAVSAEIVDCFSVKEWAIKLAVNAVNTIINVDQIVLAKPAGGPPIRQPKYQEEEDDAFSHRSGPWKQQNKRHNSGRHRSRNSEQSNANQIDKNRLMQMSMEDRCLLGRLARRNREWQLRAQKVEKVKRSKDEYGSFKSPPIAVVILPLAPRIEGEHVIGTILGSHCDAYVTNCDRNIYFMSVPSLKKRFCFLIPNHRNMIEVLDAFKIADVAVFLWDCDAVKLHDHFASLLTAVAAQGMPYHFNIPLSSRITYRYDKKRLASLVERWGLRAKFCKDLSLLLKLVANCAKQPLSLQQHHSRIIVESCSIVEQNDDLSSCTLKIDGYVRGPPLDVNRLLHIPGWGDFQMGKIEVITDPHPLHRYTSNNNVIESTTFAVADPAKQENLESQAAVDEMNNDQTWPTEEEIVQSQRDTEHLIRRLPEGTSTYQACWILEDENEASVSELNHENECNTIVFNLDEDMDSLIAVSRAESVDDQQSDVEMSEDETECSDENDVHEVERCRREKEERENEKFPDEVDTPLDISAAERFQKYRGLASFRTSYWNPEEELPPEYGRIFQFQNFKATYKRIVNEEKHGAPAGWFTSVHVLNVPLKLVEECMNSKKQPLVVYELLPHEQKMSVVNVTIRKNHLFNETVKSKDRLLFQIGYRRFFAAPIFSQHTIGDKHKFQRFLPTDEVTVASMYAPIIFGPAGVVVLRVEQDGSTRLVATGNVLSVDPTRLNIKRAVLSGVPSKINRTHAVIRHMFFNRDDVLWFKPVELRTSSGRRGHIKEPLGTHGRMKCVFNGQLTSQDVVFMDLYKRVFPKWIYDPDVTIQLQKFKEGKERDELMEIRLMIFMKQKTFEKAMPKNEVSDNLETSEYVRDLKAQKELVDPSLNLVHDILENEIVRSTNFGEPEYLDIYNNKVIRVVRKVALPVKECPDVNFVGKLLGPGGGTVKFLQQAADVKISIMGRGSVRDPEEEDRLLRSGDPKYKHLKDDLHVRISAYGVPSDAYKKLAIAIDQIQQILFNDGNQANYKYSEMSRNAFMHSGGGFRQRGMAPLGRGAHRGRMRRGGRRGGGIGRSFQHDATVHFN
ncbi:T-complex protein 1 subunit theta [Trichinella pseudospiralis]|uniref:Pre-rRNA-processing protein TSR1 homolog n=1 Tax=Trichinella pseudospiralis TaxID=6337 RepID=A0A0V1INA8_TRIPS|nr:T-complex protein 1 subunit theta [Trichinella pseudospiralis]